MATIELTLTVVSPTFMYGAYQRGSDTQPEMRAQSVRGQLRYWLRAILGAGTTELKQVWDAESAVFGSTGMGSAVGVRVYPRSFEPERVPMMPHKSNPHDRKRSEQQAIPEGTSASLQLVTRPGVDIPNDALNALKVWSLLGGAGKRSRRMFGAVAVTTKDDTVSWYAPPTSPEALAATIKDTLNEIVKNGPDRGVPSFPTLHERHSWVIVGKRDFSSAEEANERLFCELLRSPKYLPHEDTFGTAKGGLRRASPLHAQVCKVNGKYYPVLTALRSLPDSGENWKAKYQIEWEILAAFMTDAAKLFDDGETVWGGW